MYTSALGKQTERKQMSEYMVIRVPMRMILSRLSVQSPLPRTLSNLLDLLRWIRKMCSVKRLEYEHHADGDGSANSRDDGAELMEGEASRNVILGIWRLLVICR